MVTPQELMGLSDATPDFSEESANLISLIRKDKELTEALKIYFSLSEEKKAFILQSIKVISINE